MKQLKKIAMQYKWWQWLLFFFGIISILSALGAFFLAAGSEPSGKYFSGNVPEVSDSAFVNSLGYGLHSQTGIGGEVTPLTNGNEFKDSLLKAIDESQSSINFSVYIWEKGEFASQVLEKLTAKQEQGVEVRILLDYFGSKSIPDSAFEPLQKAGGKVETFRSIKFGQIKRFGHRDHRRSIVMDGIIGFTGGMAIADKWLGNAEDSEHWRDEMYKITGPLALNLQGDFSDIWSGLSGEFLTGSKFYPELTQEKALNQDTKFVHISQNPSPDVQILPDFINTSIKAARKSIHIETPYFVPNAQLLSTILERANAGVDIQLLLPDKHNDSKIDRLAAQNYYQKLLNAGVKIFEYNNTFNHSKFMVIDGQWSIIGSPNMNTRSRRLDEENAFGILSADLGKKHKEIFSNDLKNSTEITPEQWHSRSYLKRPIEWIAKIFDKQI